MIGSFRGEDGQWSAYCSLSGIPEVRERTLRAAATREEAERLAREAWEDLCSPKKLCRGPNHVGPRELPANLRYFPRNGSHADGTPQLRSRCWSCCRGGKGKGPASAAPRPSLGIDWDAEPRLGVVPHSDLARALGCSRQAVRKAAEVRGLSAPAPRGRRKSVAAQAGRGGRGPRERQARDSGRRCRGVPGGGVPVSRPPIDPVAGGRLTVPAHLLQGRPGDHYVLKVVGDRMAEEGIFDGDYIICLRTEPRDGDACVALVGDDALITTVHREGGEWRLQPLLPGAKPILVPVADVVIQSVVVGLMRQFKRGGEGA